MKIYQMAIFAQKGPKDEGEGLKTLKLCQEADFTDFSFFYRTKVMVRVSLFRLTANVR